MRLSWFERLFLSFLPFYADSEAGGGPAPTASNAAPPTPAGQEPSPGPRQEQPTVESVAEEMRQAAAKRQAKKSQVAPKSQPSDAAKTTPAMESKDEAAGSAGAEETPWENPLRAMLKEEFPDQKAPSKEEEELPPDVQPKSRAAEAITKLRQRSQAAEGQVQQYAQAYQSLQNQVAQTNQQVQQVVGQYQQALQQVREQNAAMSARLEMLQSGKFTPNANQEPDYSQQFLTKADEHFRKTILEPALTPLQQKLQAYEQKERETQQEARINQDSLRLRNEGSSAWQNYVTKGLPEASQAKYRNLGTAVTIALQSATGQTFQQAATTLRRMILETAADIADAQRQSTLAAKKNQEAAPSNPEGGGLNKEVGGHFTGEMPPMLQLLQNGYKDPAAWARAGKPRLKPIRGTK